MSAIGMVPPCFNRTSHRRRLAARCPNRVMNGPAGEAAARPFNPVKQTSSRTWRHVADVPILEIAAASLDDLVGTSKQRRRHGQTERLGGLEIHNQFKLGRLFDREIPRRCSLENLVDESRGATI
jgi:hypothetical protein